MKCSEILKQFEKDFPLDAAEEWDNPGLLTGRRDAEIHKVYVTLDATESLIDDAAEKGADLIVSHHPMIFSAMKQVNDTTSVGRRILKLCESGISCIAAHTNFDVRKMADLNEAQLALKNAEVLMETGERDGVPEGIGRVGELSEEMDLASFCQYVKSALDIPNVVCYGDPRTRIRRAAVSGGSGRSVIPDAERSGADVLVTGDIDYHSAIDANAAGLCIVDAGHYGTEYCFIEYMAGYFAEHFPELEVVCAPVRNPYTVY
ncbi:MAG: Nif3-like dinuclear metal center hexameric protein [Bilifractor sp.]|jgi:dinuclear metal center YbgI/SA1388 family protein